VSTPNISKLNRILQKAVPGTVLTSTWLAEHGVSKDLARKYVASGWLDRIGHGAYMRAGETARWNGALFALQTQLEMNVHVAGLSALQLKGLAHFLPAGQEKRVLLFSDGVERVPSWFSKKDWGVELAHRCVQLFDDSEKLPVSDIQCQGFSVRASSPERAAFELLYSIQNNSDFDYARILFDGFSSFRPGEVQKLLSTCRSVRVKRTFLWMAGECSHPWWKYVDLTNVGLGSGKRVVYGGGALDRELQITVPKKGLIADV